MLHCAARKVSQAVSATRHDRRQVSHAVKLCRQRCGNLLSGKDLQSMQTPAACTSSSQVGVSITVQGQEMNAMLMWGVG